MSNSLLIHKAMSREAVKYDFFENEHGENNCEFMRLKFQFNVMGRYF
jgi:hypothetical protein